MSFKRNGHAILPVYEFEEIPIQDEACGDRQEMAEAFFNFLDNIFHILNAYQSHQKSTKQLRMSSRAMQLALGCHLAAGADGPSELARKCGVGKHTFGKCMNHFMEQLNLAPLPFQRRPEARRRMSEARKAQL